MTMIQLHTASVDNAGRYLAAGTSVCVGSAPGEIAVARARELVAEASAVDASLSPTTSLLEAGKPARKPARRK